MCASMEADSVSSRHERRNVLRTMFVQAKLVLDAPSVGWAVYLKGGPPCVYAMAFLRLSRSNQLLETQHMQKMYVFLLHLICYVFAPPY
eukprot:IDg20404t1